MKRAYFILAILVASLSGCETYQPMQVADRVTLRSAAHLEVDAKPVLSTHRFDPSDGLDMTEVAMLAVANNPALRLARDDAGIARAQAYSAGLLPDPQLSVGNDFPQQSVPGTVKAYNVGLGYDINSLLTHALISSASGMENRKTDLNLLWQEWQVIAQARLLFSRVMSQEILLHWLTENQSLLKDRYEKARGAEKDGLVASDAVNIALAAWQDAARQVNDLQRLQLQTWNDLDALLGLQPGIRLRLAAGEAVVFPDDAEVEQALARLADRRPDLLALKAGFAAQDARYRAAILGQFPPLNLAFTRSRDNVGINMYGFALTLALPILNGNRGNIRIEQATRQRMRDEYQNRLNADYAEVRQLIADGSLIGAQLQTSEAGLHELEETAPGAVSAFSSGDLDGAAFAAIVSSRIAKRIEVARLQQSLLEGKIALLTLLGAGAEGMHP
jgi:outer membrane protein TolC